MYCSWFIMTCNNGFLPIGETWYWHKDKCWWHGDTRDQVWRFHLLCSAYSHWALAHLPNHWCQVFSHGGSSTKGKHFNAVIIRDLLINQKCKAHVGYELCCFCILTKLHCKLKSLWINCKCVSRPFCTVRVTWMMVLRCHVPTKKNLTLPNSSGVPFSSSAALTGTGSHILVPQWLTQCYIAEQPLKLNVFLFKQRLYTYNILCWKYYEIIGDLTLSLGQIINTSIIYSISTFSSVNSMDLVKKEVCHLSDCWRRWWCAVYRT